MTKFERIRRICTNPTLNALSIALLTSCVGTEADNPVVEPAEPTPCKSHEEYAPFQLADARFDLARRNGEMLSLLAEGASSTKATAFANLGDSLTPSNQFPRWLECIEWSYDGSEVVLQIVNFTAGCGVEWAGSTSMPAEGKLEVGLDNVGCRIAGCGYCYYDVRAKHEVPKEQATLGVDLVLRACDVYDESTFSWELPLAEAPRGMQCKALPDWTLHFENENFTTAQRTVYATCGESAVVGDDTTYAECAEGLDCVADRCLEPCTTAADCSLLAFECTDGHCRLPE